MESLRNSRVQRLFAFRSILFVFVVAFIFSCETDTNAPILPVDKPVKKVYLVDYKKEPVEYTKKEMKGLAILVDAYGVNIPFVNKIENNIQIYTIKYNTTFEGKDVVASGLVVLPKGDKEFPLLSFQNGTSTLHSKAPSVDYNSMIFKMFDIVAATGFIVVVPDYLGFGASKTMYHPYMDKKSTVNSVVDMLRAVKELANGEKVKVKSTKDVYIAGYSQGGWATMCVQKALEQDNGKNFHLVASSCGAGPYNLETVIEYVLKRKSYNNPYFLAYVFNTMVKKGLLNQQLIDKMIRAPYNEIIQEDLFDGTHSGDEINRQLSTNVAEMFTYNFIKNYKISPDFKVIRDFLQKNSVKFWKTEVPTKLYHGGADVDIPFATSQEAYDKMLGLGTDKANLELVKIPNQTHGQAVLPAELETVNWFLELRE